MKNFLTGRRAIITGANQGLGLEIARKFVVAGADLMLCARNERMLEDARAELTGMAATGQKIEITVADVSKETDALEVVAQTLERLGGCHILVNNAGVYGPKGEIDSVDWSDWMKTIEINVYGSVLMSRAVLPHFRTQRYGKVIQLSGGGGPQTPCRALVLMRCPRLPLFGMPKPWRKRSEILVLMLIQSLQEHLTHAC